MQAQSPSSAKRMAPAAVKDLLSLQRRQQPGSSGAGTVRVKEKGKSNHCDNKVEPGPPCMKARSKMPLSLCHRTPKVKCTAILGERQ